MKELYEYQRKAVDELKNGSVLCGGVGTGKSLTSIVYYYTKECKGSLETMRMEDPKDLYIITTAKKRDDLDWLGECAPFSLSDDPNLNINHVKVIIDSWNNIKKYTDIEHAFFIFDEQRVVGYGAWTKSFLQITKKNHWILLSATPADTWTDYIPLFIANGFYRNKSDFLEQHVIYDRYSKFPKVDRYINCKKLVRNRDNILVNMVADRFKKTEHINMCCLYNEDLYKDVQKRRWDVFKNEPIKNINGLCHVLRRVTNENPDRITAITQIMISHQRIIIFYNFDTELELLIRWCENDDIQYAQWNGHAHEKIPKTDMWVYLVQYTAGAEGWNCIETDTMVFFSQNYSYRIMVQAAGRIDRLDTPFDKLYYYHLVSRSPIDLAIKRTLANKKNFSERRFVKW